MKRQYPWFAICGIALIACSLAWPVWASRVDDSATAETATTQQAEDSATDTEAAATSATTVMDLERVIPETPEGGWDVYVVPIDGAIMKPQLYILKRALKEAITNGVEVVLLDINTPGGDLHTTLEMMESLDYFDGTTMTFVNSEAISAGSYISIATDDIWFAPKGTMGAAAVITGQGEDLNVTLKSKIDSYLRARVRVLSKEYRYRADVQRAMMDIDYELEINGKVIKKPGELLTLTADEAVELFGNPQEPLLAQGIATDIDDLLTQKFGEGNYTIRTFEVSWSEEFAKWFQNIAPILMGAGILLLFIEMKTPGFGVFGIGGICLLLIVFTSQYFAGMAGNEPIIIFILGIILLAVEIFLVPGTLVAGLLGLVCVIGSLIWTLADIWPSGSKGFEFTPELFYGPVGEVILGLGIAFMLGLAVVKYLPHSPFHRHLVLASAVGGSSPILAAGGRSIDQTAGQVSALPEPGERGIAVTDLHPGGQVEINGKRFQARVLIGSVESGEAIEVVERGDFALVVRTV